MTFVNNIRAKIREDEAARKARRQIFIMTIGFAIMTLMFLASSLELERFLAEQAIENQELRGSL